MDDLPELLISSDVAIAERVALLAPRLQLRALVAEPGELLHTARGRSVVCVVIALPGYEPEAELCRLRELVATLDVPAIALCAAPISGLVRAALLAGAAEVVQEPVSDEELQRVLQKCLAVASSRPTQPWQRGLATERMLGKSAPMKRVMDLIRRGAPGQATVLVRGESGTGKELAALAIHELSARRAGPFVRVQCAALPDALLESELFGYEKGAFTGAFTRKSGRVELAEGGTLFLDEIGDINLAMQVKLLRLLQDRSYERLGGNETQNADVRFIAATHRDLNAMVASREFREDLFYRLNVVTLWLPPLRARRDDIAELATRFARESAEANGKSGVRLSEDALTVLRSMRWPGNARQLQNLVERLVVFADSQLISKEDVRREYADEGVAFATQPASHSASRGALSGAPPSSGSTSAVVPIPLDEEVRRAERRALVRALEHTRGNRSLAARVLGVSRATLYNKLAEHGLS